ncbi:polysaccharide deacetylase family protein [Paractinoplanes maris]|uniref:polysaccharide deacetylase family protein n=1 Tax=Paractinoplanes maris TaxID=1734446 RepID=UPI002020CC6D|nr:polysaccharide deacetylase family protein [Actinoplanes maris]
MVSDGFLRWREPVARALSRVIPGDVLWFADTTEPVFALTFDDGPHPETTPQLLEVLRRHRASATFFLIGERVAAYGELVEQIVADGHEIANHLMRDERSAFIGDERFRQDLAEVSRMLARYGPVRWFRPGSGVFTPRMLRSAAEINLRAVLGTLVAGHTGGPADEAIAGHLLASIRPGSIVVLHEGTAQRSGVAATTDDLLTALAARGPTAVTVSDLVRDRRIR